MKKRRLMRRTDRTRIKVTENMKKRRIMRWT